MNVIINLNKSRGITSHQAVSAVKRLFGAKKVGHAGTLDPLATGVLLVCVNEATKISRFLLDMDKRYKAKVRLGITTDTGDAEGRIIEEKDASGVSEDELGTVVKSFAGVIKQKPPMYSAVKVGGEKLYKLARKGLEVERPERVIEIYSIDLLDVSLPFFDLGISCSKGTYVRTLCEDIGRKLGTGAHLAALERTATGFFDIHDSVTLGELEKAGFSPREKYSNTMDAALRRLGEIVLDEPNYRKALNGSPIIVHEINELAEDSFVRLKSPSGELFGIGRTSSQNVRIERLLNL